MKQLNPMLKYAPIFIMCSVLLGRSGAVFAYDYEWSDYTWHYNDATEHYYALTFSLTNWSDAEAEANANAIGGHLATINDDTEEAWIQAEFDLEGLFIGFTDQLVEGEWRWIGEVENPGEHWDGGIWQDPDNFPSPVQTSYTNWGPGEPNDKDGQEDGSLMNYADFGYTWIDIHDFPSSTRGLIEIPEPTALSLLAIGGLAILRRRRGR